MKVLILGAAGKTGQHLVKKAIEQGHQVTAFVRTTDRLKFATGVSVITGDARNEADVTKALQGQDAIISALGSIKSGDKLTVRFIQALVAASKQTSVKRVVMLSTFMLLPNFRKNFMAKIIGGLMKSMLNDKVSGEDLLRQSDLDWTLVYATPLDKAAPGGKVRIVPKDEPVSMTNNGIARVDVADFMLKTLDMPDSIHKSFLITVK